MKKNKWIYPFRKSLDQIIIRWVEKSKPWYAKYFKKKTTPWPITIQQLNEYPSGTLGNALGQFLDAENLQMIPKFEDHDIMHILMNYKTTVVDEIRMQFFLLGNGKRSFYMLGSILLGTLLYFRYWKTFVQEFKIGKSCLPCHHWNYKHLLHEQVSLLRNLIYKNDLGEEAPLFI